MMLDLEVTGFNNQIADRRVGDPLRSLRVKIKVQYILLYLTSFKILFPWLKNKDLLPVLSLF